MKFSSNFGNHCILFRSRSSCLVVWKLVWRAGLNAWKAARPRDILWMIQTLPWWLTSQEVILRYRCETCFCFPQNVCDLWLNKYFTVEVCSVQYHSTISAFAAVLTRWNCRFNLQFVWGKTLSTVTESRGFTYIFSGSFTPRLREDAVCFYLEQMLSNVYMTCTWLYERVCFIRNCWKGEVRSRYWTVQCEQ